ASFCGGFTGVVCRKVFLFSEGILEWRGGLRVTRHEHPRQQVQRDGTAPAKCRDDEDDAHQGGVYLVANSDAFRHAGNFSAAALIRGKTNGPRCPHFLELFLYVVETGRGIIAKRCSLALLVSRLGAFLTHPVERRSDALFSFSENVGDVVKEVRFWLVSVFL